MLILGAAACPRAWDETIPAPGMCDESPGEIMPVGAWTTGYAAPAERYGGIVVALRDGRVLLAGGATDIGNGRDFAGCISDAALFDPSVGTWRAVAPMLAPRCDGVATALSDGRVLIAGLAGEPDPRGAPPSMEVYDPVGNTWAPAGKAPQGFAPSYALATADETVLLAGRDPQDLVIVEWKAGAFRVPAPFPEPANFSWFKALYWNPDRVMGVVFDTGRVLGWDGGGGRWSVIAPGTGIHFDAIVALADGRWLAASKGFLLWDGVSDWRAAAEPPFPITRPRRGVRLSDERVLFVGEQRLGGAALYEPATDTWSLVVSAREFGHRLVPLPGGRALAFDGLNRVAMWDPAATTPYLWRRRGPAIAAPLGASVTAVGDGRLLICGGAVKMSQTSARCYVIDATTGAVAQTGSMSVSRTWHTATALPGGRVVVAGGLDEREEAAQLDDAALIRHASIETWEPASGRWRHTGDLDAPRENHAAVLLPDHRVAFIGGRTGELLGRHGFGGDLKTADVEIFDPDSGRTQVIATGIEADDRAAVVLADGRLAVFGGNQRNDGSLRDVTLVDLDGSRVSHGAPLVSARAKARAATLRDGRVLVFGGMYRDPTHATPKHATELVAELWDPRDARSRPLPRPFDAPERPEAVVALPDGRVAAGGCRDLAVWDPVSEVWTRTADLLAPREDASRCALVADHGRLFALTTRGCLLEMVPADAVP